jgi:hypothetical protein
MMDIQLPNGLATLLQDLGYNWPKSMATKLYHMGLSWLGFSDKVNQPVSEADSHASRVWSANKGEGIQKAYDAWNHPNAPHKNLVDAAMPGGQIIGAGLMICAAIVQVLKIHVIVQLVQLAIQIAQALGLAPATAGASLAAIAVAKKITSMLINLCISLAMNAVLGG